MTCNYLADIFPTSMCVCKSAKNMISDHQDLLIIDEIVKVPIMKTIILISVIIAFLFSVSKVLIFNSEPVALILLGICLIGMAKIGRNQINNKNFKYNWQTFMLLAGNTLFKKQERTQ